MSTLSPVQRWSVGGLVLACATLAIVFVVRARRPHAPPRKLDPHADDHAKEVDNGLSPLLAMADSPEASTPCETSYNSIIAGQNAAKVSGDGPLFVYIAPHDDFLARCEKLPKEVQWCMTPRYSAKHREDCAHLRPPDGVLDAMRTPRPQESAPSPLMPPPSPSQ